MATFEGVGGGADLAVLGPEVQRGQEEGGELGLLSVQLFFLHVSDVLPQDAHQRPQLSLLGKRRSSCRMLRVVLSCSSVVVKTAPTQTKTLSRLDSLETEIK